MSASINPIKVAEIIRAGFNMNPNISFKYGPGVGTAVALSFASSPSINYQGRVPQPTNSQRELYKSFLGTPVVINLEIEGASYTKDGVNYSFPDMKFDSVLVNLQQTKNIIKTPVQGLNGTIKEYISDGDWSVNIKGVIIGQNGVYPLDNSIQASDINANVTNLKTALGMNQPLVVKSWLLNGVFGIYTIVVENQTWPQSEGSIATQLFEISAMSDKPTELLIQ